MTNAQETQAATYYGITSVFCVDCHRVTRDVNEMEWMNNALDFHGCRECGGNRFIWTNVNKSIIFSDNTDDEHFVIMLQEALCD